MKMPKVSIGMPVFNGENFIKNALQSLKTQDFKNFEIIISDNASTDGTEKICREFARKDCRVRYYRNNMNIGAANNYNKVFQLARGKYFKWAAHDDECCQTMLRRCVEALDKAPDYVTAVYPLSELIDEEGRTIRSGLDRIESKDPKPHCRLAKLLWTLNMCDPIFGLIKKKYLRKTHLIGPFFGADYVLLSELVMMGQIWQIDEVLFRLRAHPKRSMAANPNALDRAAWYNPYIDQKIFVYLEWERMIWELLKSIRQSKLKKTEKINCAISTLRVHYWRRFKNEGGRLKRQIKRSFLQRLSL